MSLSRQNILRMMIALDITSKWFDWSRTSKPASSSFRPSGIRGKNPVVWIEELLPGRGDQPMDVKLQMSRGGIRRLCALILLLLFAGPWLLIFVTPGAIAEASLPACCRAHGRHKCFMRLMDQDGVASTSGQLALSQISERCPYNPSLTTSPHSNSLAQATEDVAAVGFSIASSLVAITAWPGSSLSSLANCKRGPPSPALSLETTTD